MPSDKENKSDTRNRQIPENLHAKLLEVNAQKMLTAKPPALKTVKNWVSLAKRRRKFLQY